MSKILIGKFCFCAILLFCANQGNAQCYTKISKNGTVILQGTSDYIYFRSDTNYIGFIFTLTRNNKEVYNLDIVCDATVDLASPDSLILQVENNPPFKLILKEGIVTIVDGGLHRSVEKVIITPNNLKTLQEHKVTNMTAYRGAKKIEIPIYDELFLTQQFRCLKSNWNTGD